MMMKVLPLYLRNRAEKFPRVAPGPFRTDAAVYQRAPAGGLRVTWFGHSATLVEMDGVRVLVDPVWDERAAPVRWAGPKRFFAPTLRLEEMPVVDAVLISHDHYDHLGRATVERLAGLGAWAGVRWITSAGVGKRLRGFGVAATQITELDWTQATVVAGRERGAALTVTALPARHFSGRSLLDRNTTLWSSFVLRGARHGVYYGADSGWWEGFGEIGAAYGPFDLTMLEVGAFHPLWGEIHLGPANALRAFAALGGKGMMMPVHWGLFDLALHGWREPIEQVLALASEEGVRVWSPEPGVPTEVEAGTEVRSRWWVAE